MPQLLALALVGGAAYLGVRWLRRAGKQVAEDLTKAEDAVRRQSADRLKSVAGTPLERDPATGVYRPQSSGDEASAR